MDDQTLLNLVAAECRSSVGFDNNPELTEARERALEYARGVMTDVPSLPNRSKAVSTDIADAVETLLPDLVEIFTGDEDVAAFIPRGEEDEEAAQQETDYVNYVVFTENPGFLLLYTMFKDALLTKTGVVKAWWEDGETVKERFERKSAVALQMAEQDGEIEDLEPAEPEEGDTEPLYNFTVCREPEGRVRIEGVPPEDFTVAIDTVRLREAVYCAMRSRPRVQDLLSQGLDKDKVASLTTHGANNDQAVSVARDTVSESQNLTDADSDLRRVEVEEHYIRVYDGENPKIWRVLTGNTQSVLLDKEEVDFIPFAAVTPYIQTHRFYGESVADKLMEPQRVGTALTRMALDSGYFALNQRNEVAEDQMSANTLPNLLRNEPGVPVLSRTGNAVRPIQAGALSFDVFGALEYFQTKVEQRTGIVRAAQGLTPDTLHETARGALALLTQAQKRVRLMARNFAETGVKDMFLLVHALIRKHSDSTARVRLRNKWTEIDPTSWGERSDMSISVGLGASGREHDLMVIKDQLQVMNEVIMMQGGPTGPFVKPENVYNLLKRFYEKTGEKTPERFVSDPAEQQQGPPQPPPPDPKLVEVQAKSELAREQAEAELTMKATAAQGEIDLATHKAQLQAQLEREKSAAEIQYRRDVAADELALKREQLEAELMLKREQMAAELDLKRQQMAHEAARANLETTANLASDVQVGGEPG